MKRLLCALIAAVPGPLMAAGFPDDFGRLVSDAELAALRGGFSIETHAGPLEIRIGITRAVTINDRLLAVNYLVLPDFSELVGAARAQARAAGALGSVAGLSGSASAAQALAAAQALTDAFGPTARATSPASAQSSADAASVQTNANPGTALVVQNGPGNVAEGAVSSAASVSIPTVVQNSLNGQVLRTLTLINASVSSLSALNAVALGEMLRRATAAVAR